MSTDSPGQTLLLREERERAGRGMLRTVSTMAAILAAVLGLAAVAVLAGGRAERAEKAGRERLWHSYVAQARAARLSGHMGRREEMLTAISNAAGIRVSAELRNEALAAFTINDAWTDSRLVELPPGAVSVEFEPGLARYAVREPDGIIGIYTYPDAKKVHRLEPLKTGLPDERGPVVFTFSPDGRHFCIAMKNGTITVHDLRTGERIYEYVPKRYANNMWLGFSPEGGLLGYYDSDSREVTMLDLENRRGLEQRVKIGLRAFSFRAGTNQVAVAADRQVQVWNWETGELVGSYDSNGRTRNVEWSPDGQKLCASKPDGDVYLWDLDKETLSVLNEHTEGSGVMTFSPDSRYLMTSGVDGTTRLWDTEITELVWTTVEGRGLAFSPDGRRIGFDQSVARLGTWMREDPVGCSTLLSQGPRDEMTLLTDMSADGNWLVASRRAGLQVWHFGRTTQTALFGVSNLTSLCMHPTEPKVLLVKGGQLEFRRLALDNGSEDSSKPKLRLGPAERWPELDPAARCAALNGDGTRAVVELTNRRMLVLDLVGGKPPVYLDGRQRYIYSPLVNNARGSGRFGLSADGRYAGFGYGYLEPPAIFDAETGKLVRTLPAGAGQIAFSPAGKWLVTSAANEFHFWGPAGEKLRSHRHERLAGNHGIMAVADDEGLGAFSLSRRELELQDLATGEGLAVLSAPYGESLRVLRVAKDGSRVVAGTASNTILVWNLQALRAALRTMNLDWTQHSAPGVGVNHPSMPFLLSLATVILVAVLAVLVLSRHRRMIVDFLHLENIAEERNSQLEHTRVELAQTQKMRALGTLAAGIAHDFNNLLSVIRMSNRLIAREAPDNPEVQENTHEIEEAVKQGKHVVSSMLGYSRNGNGKPVTKPVDEVIGETVSLLSKEFLRGITLTLDVNRSLPPVKVRQGKLEQMLLNLVVNAAEAMKSHGRLTMSARLYPTLPAWHLTLRPADAPTYVGIHVADTGPGIPAENQGRIFEPFYTTKIEGARPGTGLGLSVVYSIAEQEGLGLGVHSEPGRGSTFHVFIPTANADEFASNPSPVQNDVPLCNVRMKHTAA